MEVTTDFENLNRLYHENFSLGFIDKDFSTKVALISLLGYLVLKLKDKDPLITYLKVIKSIAKDMKFSDKFLYTLAIVCEDFSYGCTSFPTFGIEDRNIPAKVKELLKMCTPF